MLGKHKMICKSHKNTLEYLKTINGIKKIILGCGKGGKHAKPPGQLEFCNFTDSGIRYKAFTNRGVRDIFVICKDHNKKKIHEKILKKGEQYGKSVN